MQAFCDITTILEQFPSISLQEMKKVKLMNRTDTKFVTTEEKLCALLELAKGEYFVQSIDNCLVMPYSTRYYDTECCEMYCHHLHGKKTRKKVRERCYVSSGLKFLEVKRKNNKGRTDKKRVETATLTLDERKEFLKGVSGYEHDDLIAQIDNFFHRITLVNKTMTERLTIDIGLKFHNLRSGNDRDLSGLVIIELKRDGRTFSPIADMLKQLRIKPSGFSKYCMGMAFTNNTLPNNRFKPRMHKVEKLLKS